MEYTEKITQEATYRRYLAQIGQVPSHHLNNSFNCGLPAAWLYMRMIGLEDAYFNMLKKVKQSSIWFRELFYLLMHTNKGNPYFSTVADNTLSIDVPPEIAAAQIDMPAPEFELAFAFTRDQLIDTLKSVALPGKLLRLGNRQKAIAIMRNDNGTYAFYHAGIDHALEFNNIENCVDAVIRIINGK